MKLTLKVLEARVAKLEEQIQISGLLPAYLSLMAADAQVLQSVCEQHGITPANPRCRHIIVRELKQRGWSHSRIMRVTGWCMDTVGRQVRRAAQSAPSPKPPEIGVTDSTAEGSAVPNHNRYCAQEIANVLPVNTLQNQQSADKSKVQS